MKKNIKTIAGGVILVLAFLGLTAIVTSADAGELSRLSTVALIAVTFLAAALGVKLANTEA